jgi:hypothetical protein
VDDRPLQLERSHLGGLLGLNLCFHLSYFSSGPPSL